MWIASHERWEISLNPGNPGGEALGDPALDILINSLSGKTEVLHPVPEVAGPLCLLPATTYISSLTLAKLQRKR